MWERLIDQLVWKHVLVLEGTIHKVGSEIVVLTNMGKMHFSDYDIIDAERSDLKSGMYVEIHFLMRRLGHHGAENMKVVIDPLLLQPLTMDETLGILRQAGVAV